VAQPAPAVPPAEVALPAGPLDEAESKALFARFGIPPVREQACATPAEAAKAAREIGARLVLKALSRHLAHKSDVGGVRLGLAAEEIEAAGQEMLARVAAATRLSGRRRRRDRPAFSIRGAPRCR
jgi:acyl-CoA synthetase (NDP forming)